MKPIGKNTGSTLLGGIKYKLYGKYYTCKDCFYHKNHSFRCHRGLVITDTPIAYNGVFPKRKLKVKCYEFKKGKTIKGEEIQGKRKKR
jgi:hypothetical protein